MAAPVTSRFQPTARGTAEFATQAELVAAVTELFTDNFNYYYKAAAFHWNAVGWDFPEFHGFFGEVYSAAGEEIDALAEWLRRFDAQAPQSLAKVGQDGPVVTDFKQGVQLLLADTEAYIGKLKAACTIANELNEQGALNYFAALMDAHQKLRWKYRAILANDMGAAPAAAPAAAEAPAEAPAPDAGA